MPNKPKSSAKASNPETHIQLPVHLKTSPASETVEQRSQERRQLTNPLEQRVREIGLSNLSLAEKKTYAHLRLIQPVTENRLPLTAKAEREFWKVVTKDGLAARRLRPRYGWGKDRTGREIGSYSPQELERRSISLARLTALDILHRGFLARARIEGRDVDVKDIEEEKARRVAMADLRRELYGFTDGALAQDPEWDDVVPILQSEPEDALAKIAYPEDYAEAVSYLRAVMADDERSPRCLRLTERVISMNPAHYTVWLYRFQLVCSLGLDIPEEIRWLDELALDHLKNYQIWHHRQLLIDHHYPTIITDHEAVRALGKSETTFIATILEKDSKNYHVWSYRQYLVEKLGLWTATELASTQCFIEDDVRNNSAWSHRFFVVFSDPAVSTLGSTATARDEKVPASIIDRELAYAQEKILLAPQNQSGWNYLRGVLAKGGRDVVSMAAFADRFVQGLGQENESVRSSHALDLLADIYKEMGDVNTARLCLQRLWEKWDPVREGYWKYRAKEL
ncbi:protein farnesyltransferase [Ophiocordyceps camponoti-floridani]|uniref:Protein farnesyltransferase/geranylgeranyltransferase type-1 subunit alpha n=1 Tax=Ophiocordyceps camponoti-floridani TaxID=2030778 RepID=A0A8H4Q888_9HYPO|nr:protein farnesyltransferase [Ophiocordyceps camponoti-floridani]